MSILVVDDTDDTREMTATFLGLMGFTVNEARTGSQALERAAEQPDLIILDVRLPDMDGFEVCRRLKADPTTATIPVLHLSAHHRTPNDRIRGIEEGADAYLLQPADPDELIATVKALLRRRQHPDISHVRSASEISLRLRAEEAATALVDVGRALSAAPDVTRVTQRAVETVHRLFRVRRSVFYEFDRTSSTLVCVATAGEDSVGEWLDRTIPFGEGVAGLAVAERRVVSCSDVLREGGITLPSGFNERMQEDDCRAIASVPLVVTGEVLGAWSLVDRTGRTFSDDELRLLAAFADQVALAMQNARLSETLERQLQESHGLLRVAQLLNSSIEPREIARRASREVTRLLGADTSIFFEVDEPRGDIIGVAGYHIPSVVWDPEYRVALRDLPPVFREAAVSGRPIVSHDVPTDLRLTHPVIHAMPMAPRSLLCVPVLRNGRVSGALLICWWSISHHIKDAETRLALGVAHQLVLAQENARLHEAQEQRRRETETRLARMKALTELSHLLSSSLDVSRVLNFVTTAVLALLDGDLAHLWIVDEEAQDLRLAAEAPRHTHSPAMTPRLPLGAGVVGWVIEHKRAWSSEDILQESRVVNKDWLTGHGYVSVVAIPLVIGDRAVGALAVLTKTPRKFEAEDAELLKLFGTTAATALENARLYQDAQRAYDELRQAQNQLVQSQKMEALGQLAGGIAHDFNNLLTVIQGRTELMLKRLSVDAELRRDVQTVSETAHRAAVLTRQLLAFSRRQLLQPRAVSVNRVVTGVAAMLERLVGEDIVLHLDLAPELGTVRVDPGRLEQVIINLGVNARDAQPRGGTLWIRTENIVIAPDDTSRPRVLPAGDYVALTMSDRGCGMDDATLARIFEPFFTTKKPGEGTGLGLSTVYGIVTQSGGHIAVSSERDRGTTFTIRLPRVYDPLDPEVSDSVDNQAGGSETILVVEDDDEVRALARDILEDYGYKVIEAKNGEQALEIFNRGIEQIELIVTDVVMPELSGQDLAAHFQRHAPGTRIVFISGYPTQLAGPDNVLDAGQSFLSKPFSPRSLAEAVRRALDT